MGCNGGAPVRVPLRQGCSRPIAACPFALPARLACRQIKAKQALACTAEGCEGGTLRFKVMMYDDGEGGWVGRVAPPGALRRKYIVVAVLGGIVAVEVSGGPA